MSNSDSWYTTELDPRAGCQVLVFPALAADEPDPDPGEAAAA